MSDESNRVTISRTTSQTVGDQTVTDTATIDIDLDIIGEPVDVGIRAALDLLASHLGIKPEPATPTPPGDADQARSPHP